MSMGTSRTGVYRRSRPGPEATERCGPRLGYSLRLRPGEVEAIDSLARLEALILGFDGPFGDLRNDKAYLR